MIQNSSIKMNWKQKYIYIILFILWKITEGNPWLIHLIKRRDSYFGMGIFALTGFERKKNRKLF